MKMNRKHTATQNCVKHPLESRRRRENGFGLRDFWIWCRDTTVHWSGHARRFAAAGNATMAPDSQQG